MGPHISGLMSSRSEEAWMWGGGTRTKSAKPRKGQDPRGGAGESGAQPGASGALPERPGRGGEGPPWGG